ncbi:MAG: type I 3-dehydroquinate dehydratase [Provencibacterium sp.]|nr:type I 3-dehydroquinate dehydratase [Provencibacterium sp.]
MKPVFVRGVTIGEGSPKICMPLVARNRAGLRAAAREAAGLRPDLLEWRADYYEGLNAGDIPELLWELRGEIGEMPLLFTFRSSEEGGVRPLPEEGRLSLMEAAVEAGADLLDAELSLGEGRLGPLLAHAHARCRPVILSNHHFEGTPPVAEMVDILRREQACGGDIAKLAVMPHSPADLLALLEATLRMQEQFARIPLITMSMGAVGLPSRVCGGLFGSAVTFGAGRQASAPGQIGVQELRAFCRALNPPEN